VFRQIPLVDYTPLAYFVNIVRAALMLRDTRQPRNQTRSS